MSSQLPQKLSSKRFRERDRERERYRGLDNPLGDLDNPNELSKSFREREIERERERQRVR